MTEPENLERERASDVPEGAEVRADGSYVTPAEDLTEEQKAELLAKQEAERESEGEGEDQEVEASSPREVGEMTMPREQGTDVEGQA